MNWPDTEKAERLMRADGLTGAEMEALAEFLSQPLNDWQFEQEREAVANQECGIVMRVILKRKVTPRIIPSPPF